MEDILNSFENENEIIYKSYRLNHFSLIFLKNFYLEKQKCHGITNFVIQDDNVVLDRVSFNDENMQQETSENGKYQFLIGSSAIVSFYQLWEDKYRKKISNINNNNNNKLINSEVYYELAKLRHSILHNDRKPNDAFNQVANQLKFLISNDKLVINSLNVEKIYKIIKIEIENIKKEYTV